MKINRIIVHRAQLPLRRPWRTAYGEERFVESLFAQAFDADGRIAWVECCPLTAPLYLPDCAETSLRVIERFVAPLVLGKEFDSAVALGECLSQLRGNSFAKATVEMCWWALEATAREESLSSLIGGTHGLVPAGKGFGIDSVAALIDRIGAAVAAGFERMKLKIRPGHDYEILKPIREQFPETMLQVDCNGSYGIDDFDALRRLDELGLTMIEQPLHYRDLADHAALQRVMETPICLDESITCVADAERALRLRACKIINIKPGRVGGIGPALAIMALCRRHNARFWIGGMLESDLGTAINIELASACDGTLPHDLPCTGDFYDVGTTTGALLCAEPGELHTAEGPWVGQMVKAHLIHEMAVETIELLPQR